MPLTITDPVTEALVLEVAAFTDESPTVAVREALRERRQRLLAARAQSKGQLRRFLVDEVWPQIPARLLGGAVAKREREGILGI
jgi:antitoxin VapB